MPVVLRPGRGAHEAEAANAACHREASDAVRSAITVAGLAPVGALICKGARS